MPLPEGGDKTLWPPPEWEPIYQQYATWAAWYAGDVESLSNIYGGSAAANHEMLASETGGFKAAARRAASAVRRWFWGQPTARTQNRTRLHVPIAGDIAATSADLLFAEPPKVTVVDSEPSEPDEDGAETRTNPTQARLDELLDDGAHATLLEAAEIDAALGGVFLRVVWDPAVKDRPWFSAVHPDAAVPVVRQGQLTSVIFWRIIHTQGRIVVRHLECHEPGWISHGVYQGDADTLGQPVPLTDYDATRHLANDQLVNGNQIQTRADKLTAVYVPNMRPNRIWRNNPHAAYLGRSDYAGVEPMMDALDMAQSSLMRDVDLGKARLIVPQEYLISQGKGNGSYLDLDQEVYEGLNIMGREDGQSEIKEVQFEIRHEAHGAVIADLKRAIVTSAGYSGDTFGLTEGDTAITATEVTARNRRSLITRDRKTRYWKPALADLFEALLGVDAGWFDSGVTPQRPNIEFAPTVQEDPKALAEELELLDRARAISTFEKVRRQHPDWEPEQVQVEVDRIKAETMVENPDEFQPPPDDDPEGEEPGRG